MCTRAGQGVSDPSHPLHQTALSANGLQVSTASERFFFGMSQHYTLPSGYFFMWAGLWCLRVRPWVGGWGLCGRLGPNEKLHNSGLLCLFTLSPSCQDLRVGGGGLHYWNRSRLHSFRFCIIENLRRNTETINSVSGSNVQHSWDHSKNRFHWNDTNGDSNRKLGLWKVSHLPQHFCSPLSSDFTVCLPCSFSPGELFVRHHGGQCDDVLGLLHRGHVNHAATEGERTLIRETRAEGGTLKPN